MSTIYVFHEEITDSIAASAVDVGDIFLAFDTSAGRTKKISGTALRALAQGASVTAGTVTSNAAVVVDGSKRQDFLDVTTTAFVGTFATSKVGFFGASAVVQPASSSQASTASSAISQQTSTATTSTTPFGFTTSTQAELIATRLNSVIDRVNALSVLSNQTRAELVTLGIIKGSA